MTQKKPRTIRNIALLSLILGAVLSLTIQNTKAQLPMLDVAGEVAMLDSIVKLSVQIPSFDEEGLAEDSLEDIIDIPVEIISTATYPFKRGRIPSNFTADCSKAVFPTMGNICSDFGSRRGRNHSGVDLKLQLGDTVVAAFDGVVKFAKSYYGYGKFVVVTHVNGLETAYSHLSKICVVPGQKIRAGSLVGLGGRTGRATTTHLHFEVRVNGQAINPNHIFDFKNKALKTETYAYRQRKATTSKQPINIAQSGDGVHVVRSGDSLFRIAKAYGVTIDKLCNLNGIERGSTLRLGQKIKYT